MPLPPSDLDATDPLAGFAAEFYKPPGQIYLDGNSLGLLCQPAEAAIQETIESWRSRAILGWTAGPEPWFEMSRKAAGLLAPLLGAEPADVMVGGSTTANLHQLLATFWESWRPGILIDEWAFPSDRYAVESHLRTRDPYAAEDLRVVPHQGNLIVDGDVLSRMQDGVGLAVLPSVVYRSGQLLDLRHLTGEARRRGITILWDCSHSAGVIPHEFRADEIDIAFGCGYKYLNGGPGAAAWLYVHPRLRDRLPGLAGWFGSDPGRQFAMAAEFVPAADAGRFQIGTPHVLSVAPLLGALDLINRAGVTSVREKSLRQTTYLRELVHSRLSRFGVTPVTPSRDERRGGHLTLAHPAAGNLSRALRARGVIPDFRPPDLLRLAQAPLYTSFAECAAAIDVLEDILATSAHEHLTEPADRVT
jgi:kynureninase